MKFLGIKSGILWAKKLMERLYLPVTEKFLFWTFRWREIWFFESRNLQKRWYLLITEKFLFWTFWWWEIRSFLSQEVDGKMIFTGYWEVLVLNFSVMGNTVFFQPKSWWKDDIYLVFLSFPWYSRTWLFRAVGELRLPRFKHSPSLNYPVK